jgi:hypothetical protein
MMIKMSASEGGDERESDSSSRIQPAFGLEWAEQPVAARASYVQQRLSAFFNAPAVRVHPAIDRVAATDPFGQVSLLYIYSTSATLCRSVVLAPLYAGL